MDWVLSLGEARRVVEVLRLESDAVAIGEAKHVLPGPDCVRVVLVIVVDADLEPLLSAGGVEQLDATAGAEHHPSAHDARHGEDPVDAADDAPGGHVHGGGRLPADDEVITAVDEAHDVVPRRQVVEYEGAVLTRAGRAADVARRVGGLDAELLTGLPVSSLTTPSIEPPAASWALIDVRSWTVSTVTRLAVRRAGPVPVSTRATTSSSPQSRKRASCRPGLVTPARGVNVAPGDRSGAPLERALGVDTHLGQRRPVGAGDRAGDRALQSLRVHARHRKRRPARGRREQR